MSEMQFTRRVVKGLKEMNALVFAIVGSGYMQQSGWPDRYVHHSKWQGWIEFKGKTTKLAPLQKHHISELNRRKPHSAFVVREPGIIEDKDGNELGNFYGTGQGLLKQLLAIVQL